MIANFMSYPKLSVIRPAAKRYDLSKRVRKNVIRQSASLSLFGSIRTEDE